MTQIFGIAILFAFIFLVAGIMATVMYAIILILKRIINDEKFK